MGVAYKVVAVIVFFAVFFAVLFGWLWARKGATGKKPVMLDNVNAKWWSRK